MKKKVSQNNKGFSLAEVLVTVGVMSVVSLGLAQLIGSVKLNTEGVKRTLTANEVSMTISNILKNDDACTRVLNGQSAALNSTLDFSDGNPANTFLGQIKHHGYPAVGLYIYNLKIKSSQAPTAPSTKWLTTIVLEMKNADASGTELHSGGVSSLFPREFLVTHTKAGATFNTCEGYNDTPTEQAECESMGGVWTGAKCSMCESLGGYWNAIDPTKCEIWAP